MQGEIWNQQSVPEEFPEGHRVQTASLVREELLYQTIYSGNLEKGFTTKGSSSAVLLLLLGNLLAT